MPTGAERGQVLVAIMNNKADLSILQEQGWYRIPVAKAPYPDRPAPRVVSQ
jgi:hypothetical protein